MRLDDGRVVPNFIQQALKNEPLTIYGDGSQTRSFCFVDDLIDGIYRLLISEEHYPINIGNPAEVSIIGIAHVMNELTGKPAGNEYKNDKRLGDDPQRRQPDITRAQTILGWLPKTNLKDGLQTTIEYFSNKIKSL
jgi:dTDP-glucose 4,6-dehydratase